MLFINIIILFFICFALLNSSSDARPEASASLPSYYYNVPANLATIKSEQKTFDHLPPTNSYGTPILRPSNLVQQPSRNYLSEFQSVPEIQKHIYVHVAPPEFEETPQKFQQAPVPVVARKHYKIIFVKVPSYPAQYLQQQQQQLEEEKTLIYLLLKKPEDAEIQPNSQLAIQNPINKPEVYFIKYKGKDQQEPNNNKIQNNNEAVVENNAAQITNSGYHYNNPIRGILK